MKINVVDYDPSWPKAFERIEKELVIALGPVPYVAIHHVGSTSVRNLAAKPIIDIDIVVLPRYISAAMASLSFNGYTYNPEHPSIVNPRFDRLSFRWDWHTHDQGASRVTEDGAIRRAVYLNTPEGESLRSHLAVRDTLRSNDDLKIEYGRVKQRLKEQEYENISYYVAAKDDILSRIIAQSEIGLVRS